MLSSIPHQKFCFYHFPTRGRAGIKLGDAWYVSNVSIIFYCSMLYYILFWTLLGFIIHFYITFGTNLLTQSPVPVSGFFPCFSVSKKRNIKRSPNRMKPSGALFLEQIWSGEPGLQVKKLPKKPRDRRPRPPYGARPLFRGPLGRPPTYFFLLYIPCRHSTGGGSNHEGPLHQHPCPSDELWAVYHRPTGP